MTPSAIPVALAALGLVGAAPASPAERNVAVSLPQGAVTRTTVAAAPPYIMVTGPRLAKPVLLSDWQENLALLVAAAASPAAKSGNLRGLSTRPRYDLALFWGWSLDSPPPTKPSDASAHGSFYPVYKGRPALIRVKVNGEDSVRVASQKVLGVFAKHGVPTRM